MKISARNILPGKVSKIAKGAVNSEVELTLPGGEMIVAIITNTSVETLALAEGVAASAIIKASEVIVGTHLGAARLSARNILSGIVESIGDGAVNSEVILALPGGSRVIATITKQSVEALDLKAGSSASAIIKSSNVLIGVE